MCVSVCSCVSRGVHTCTQVLCSYVYVCMCTWQKTVSVGFPWMPSTIYLRQVLQVAKTLLSRPVYLTSKLQETAFCCFPRIRVPYMPLYLEFLCGFWILNSAPHAWNKSSHQWCFPIINTLTEPTFNICVYLCSNILLIFLHALYWEKLHDMLEREIDINRFEGEGMGNTGLSLGNLDLSLALPAMPRELVLS